MHGCGLNGEWQRTVCQEAFPRLYSFDDESPSSDDADGLQRLKLRGSKSSLEVARAGLLSLFSPEVLALPWREPHTSHTATSTSLPNNKIFESCKAI